MKKRFPILAGLLSAVILFSAAACGEKGWYDKDMWYTEGGSSAPAAEVVLPTEGGFTDVYVHDPSVFYDDVTEKYYAFGTHFAVASSTDLIKWTQEATDYDFAKLYGTNSFTYEGKSWPTALKPAVELVAPKKRVNNQGQDETISSTWAPDVMKIDGRYYMYFSLTQEFGSAVSLIGRVSARNVMGPYSNFELIVRSQGFNGQPNCIDPELFYDKDGKLFMVYGSHYNGIYIKELDKDGLPVNSDIDSDDYYGTLVWKGGSTIVEGPFVFYNAENENYYLMTTYGELAKDYNMRVARSTSPTGPYTDIANHTLTTYSDANGVKLAGNYQFSGGGSLKVGTGHNSVVKVDGKYLVISHVRNAINGEHHVEVHQLYFNKDGWPVLSPSRYVGEAAGLVESVDGTYDVIVHTEGTSQTTATSAKYTFEGGKIKDAGGEEVGSYTLTDKYYVAITLENVTYNGVVAPGWKEYGTAKGVLCLTATSDAGRPLWANAV